MQKTIIFVMILLFLLPSVVAENKTIITPTPLSVTAKVNEIFIVNLSVLPGELIDTVAIDTITWDANISIVEV